MREFLAKLFLQVIYFIPAGCLLGYLISNSDILYSVSVVTNFFYSLLFINWCLRPFDPSYCDSKKIYPKIFAVIMLVYNPIKPLTKFLVKDARIAVYICTILFWIFYRIERYITNKNN